MLHMLLKEELLLKSANVFLQREQGSLMQISTLDINGSCPKTLTIHRIDSKKACVRIRKEN